MLTGFVLTSAVTGALAVAAAPLGSTALLSLRYPEPASLLADRGHAPATRTLAGPPAPAAAGHGERVLKGRRSHLAQMAEPAGVGLARV